MTAGSSMLAMILSFPPQRAQPYVDTETHGALRAKAFMLFGVTRPTAAQLHKAHAALFGPLLCETCG